MRKTTVLFILLSCSALSAAGQNLLLRAGYSRTRRIDLRIREERRERVINASYLTALVAGVVLPRLYPHRPEINMGIPAAIAVSTLTYAFIIDNNKPKNRK